jgi:hypothetical protein
MYDGRIVPPWKELPNPLLWSNKYSPNPSTGGNFVGFTAVRQASLPVDGTRCNSTYSTVLVWRCDESKTWDPSTNDASPYFISSTFDSFAPCIVSAPCPADFILFVCTHHTGSHCTKFLNPTHTHTYTHYTCTCITMVICHTVQSLAEDRSGLQRSLLYRPNSGPRHLPIGAIQFCWIVYVRKLLKFNNYYVGILFT